KKEFGVIGVQHWFHANGVDESNVKEPYRPKSKGLGNSQVLPRDYVVQYEIELVLKEMAEQVAIRLRRARKKTTNVAIFIGYSKSEQKRPINTQMRIEPTQNTKTLSEVVITLFRKKYTGGAVRSIGVRYENFVSEDIVTYSLFDDVE
ncbi:DinB/UmuC family translesion DNA polymerase, partial [Streptococcus hyointestinalis]|uniref:DinB/UmuC family translesion DNA polymerase n=1 Tax=Streptococcus hyointestinalis TaxID=1337 RepID=UPI003F9747F3